jgi:integrase
MRSIIIIVTGKPVIIIAASTGMRRGEILNLKWKNIDFENGFIRVEKSKNHESRDIPMDKYLSETLKSSGKSREIGNYVFCKENGDVYKRIDDSFRRPQTL